MFLVSLFHILLFGALKVAIGDLLQPLLWGLTLNGAADALSGAEDLPDHAGEVDGVGPGSHYSATRGRG